MQEIPIVLFHKSEADYAEHALRSARYFNNPVTIITDVNSPLYSRWADVVMADTLQPAALQQLSKTYRHLSGNSYEFEYTCIERWFILLEYMKQRQLDRAVYIDSDVLSYCNYTDIIEKYYSTCDFCLCTPEQDHEKYTWAAAAHISMWKLNALQAFCDFIIETYSSRMDDLLKKWHWHQTHDLRGGICDMTLLYLFQRNTGLKPGNFLAIRQETCFDNSIKSASNLLPDEFVTAPNFLMGSSIKKIIFKEQLPYGIYKKNNTPVLFHALHFQADAKKLMYAYLPGKQKGDIFPLTWWTVHLLYGRLRSFFFKE